MKKICIFLIKVHRLYYILLGALIGVIVFGKVENTREMIPTADMNPLIVIFLIFGVGFIEVIAMGIFYTDEERKTEDIYPKYGLVWWDHYFPIKINTELPLLKRLCGYFYVILRAVIFLASGYFLSAIVRLLSNN